MMSFHFLLPGHCFFIWPWRRPHSERPPGPPSSSLAVLPSFLDFQTLAESGLSLISLFLYLQCTLRWSPLKTNNISWVDYAGVCSAQSFSLNYRLFLMFDSRSHRHLNLSSRVNIWYLTLLNPYSFCGILHHGKWPLFCGFRSNVNNLSSSSFSDAPELGNEVPELTMSHLLKSNPPPSLDGIRNFDWSPWFYGRIVSLSCSNHPADSRTFRLGFKGFTITSTYLHDLSSDYLSNLVSQHFSFQLFAATSCSSISFKIVYSTRIFFTLVISSPWIHSLAIFPPSCHVACM